MDTRDSLKLKMRDSGLNVIVENSKDDYYFTAKKDGFSVLTIEEASRKADILFFLLPDEVQKKVFEESIDPNLKETLR